MTSGFDVLTRLNSSFADADTSTDVIGNASGSLGGAFGELPLLYPALERNALIFTEIVVVPEASTITLLGGAGLLVFAWCGSRRRRLMS